jgi:hypothetical protein
MKLPRNDTLEAKIKKRKHAKLFSTIFKYVQTFFLLYKYEWKRKRSESDSSWVVFSPEILLT